MTSAKQTSHGKTPPTGLSPAVLNLRRFVRGSESDPGLTDLGVKVGETKPGVVYCIISVTAKTQKDLDKHMADFDEYGCTCTSTGELSIECDCPDEE